MTCLNLPCLEHSETSEMAGSCQQGVQLGEVSTSKLWDAFTIWLGRFFVQTVLNDFQPGAQVRESSDKFWPPPHLPATGGRAVCMIWNGNQTNDLNNWTLEAIRPATPPHGILTHYDCAFCAPQLSHAVVRDANVRRFNGGHEHSNGLGQEKKRVGGVLRMNMWDL